MHGKAEGKASKGTALSTANGAINGGWILIVFHPLSVVYKRAPDSTACAAGTQES